MIHLGAYGQTVFSLLPSDHISGARLRLRTRYGSILLGQREIEIVAGLANIFALACDEQTKAVLIKRLSGIF